LVEDLITVEHWTATYAEFTCPDGHPNARIYIDGYRLTAHCFHTNCLAQMQHLEAELAEAADSLPERPAKIKLTPKERVERDFRRHLRHLTVTARHRVLPHLRQSPVPEEEWTRRSPYPVASLDPEEQWLALLAGLYGPTDVIWIGPLNASGLDFKDRFKTVTEWIKEWGGENEAPGPFVSLGAFDIRRLMECGWRRNRAALLRKAYMVPESDTESKETAGALIGWMIDHFHLRLRAIIDTGGKSLHPLFDVLPWPASNVPDRPRYSTYERRDMGPGRFCIVEEENPNYKAEKAEWEHKYGAVERAWQREFDRHLGRCRELNAILIGLGADPKMLASGITTRMPSYPRLNEYGYLTGKMQRLLYLDPKYPL